MSLEQTILEKASGERRFNPDQHRLYLGTLAERVILSVSLADASNPAIQNNFPTILESLQANHPDLQVKLSDLLDQKVSMTYLKTAQDLGITATIVAEDKAQSPYGIIVHGQEAVDIADPDVNKVFAQLLAPKEEKNDKKSFWKKLFG